jgi:hypothetical protein
LRRKVREEAAAAGLAEDRDLAAQDPEAEAARADCGKAAESLAGVLDLVLVGELAVLAEAIGAEADHFRWECQVAARAVQVAVAGLAPPWADLRGVGEEQALEGLAVEAEALVRGEEDLEEGAGDSVPVAEDPEVVDQVAARVVRGLAEEGDSVQ